MKPKEEGKESIDHECRLRELSDSINCTNIHIIGVPEEEERGKGEEGLFEQVIAEKFPSSGKGNRHPNPEGIEDSHQIQQKPANTNIYHSKIFKI